MDAYSSVLPIDRGSELDSIIDYDNFTDISQLTLNGNTTQTYNGLRLTSAQKKQSGSAFFDRALAIDANTSFTTQFQFEVSGGTQGADGFTFMLQNNIKGLEALGAAGGSLGYGGLDRSLAIEFDSFLNSKHDSNNNHISVLQNGDIRNSLAVATAPFDLNSGKLLNAWVDYNGDRDLLEVYLADTLVKPSTSLLSLNINLDSKENGVITPEIYTAGKGSSLLNGATSSTIYGNEADRWWYTRSWVAPNSQVFGITFDDMYYLDPNGDGSIAEVGTFTGASIGAVTHSFDMGQRFLELDFTQSGDRLAIETPESANVAPPGFYMLFAMNEQGVPSEAKIVQITPEGYQIEQTASDKMNGMNHINHTA